jgi:hypothetical protein
MQDTPAGLHILLCKLDISNDFWHLVIRLVDSFNFVYILPQLEGEPIRIVVLLALQMGWAESPPLFCEVMELVSDLTQQLVDTAVTLTHTH